METNFPACLNHVLAMEGRFSNSPSDHGSATNWGITAASLAHWRGHFVAAANVRAIAEVIVSRDLFYKNIPAVAALRASPPTRC